MMKMFSWVTKDTTIDFMKARKLTYVLSIVMVVLSIASIAIKGFNYGIDFSGGILIELKSENKINLEEMRNKINTVDVDEVNLQTIGETGTEVMIRAQAKELNEKEQMAVEQAVEEAKKFIASGDSASEAAKKAAKLSGHKKGDIYKLLQGEKDNG